MDDRDALQRRRQAMRLWLTDKPIQEILRRVQRSRAWLGKCDCVFSAKAGAVCAAIRADHGTKRARSRVESCA